jgi:hypothetical protein
MGPIFASNSLGIPPRFQFVTVRQRRTETNTCVPILFAFFLETPQRGWGYLAFGRSLEAGKQELFVWLS